MISAKIMRVMEWRNRDFVVDGVLYFGIFTAIFDARWPGDGSVGKRDFWGSRFRASALIKGFMLG
jgi:hypothetical protein